MEAVNKYVWKRRQTERIRRDADSGENNSDEEEERTLHHFKKKKHKFQHHQKPSHYGGYFGQPILFPGLYSRPPAWKPPHAVPQIINIFNQGSHGSYGDINKYFVFFFCNCFFIADINIFVLFLLLLLSITQWRFESESAKLWRDL